MPLVPPNIESLQPYIPGKPIEEVQREYGISQVDKLASNENALGPSPKALVAARAACGEMHLYPDGAAFSLKKAISERYGVPSQEIFVGNGSNELIELLVRTFVIEGEEVLTSQGTFIAYKLAAQAHGRTLVEVPMRDRHYDLEALRQRLTPRTKVVFLANPDNPTGTFFLQDALEGFLRAVRRDTLVVLDQAYLEYVDAPGFPDGLKIRRYHPNLVVLRTFSKIYGLAGLRLGYGFAGAKIVEYLDRVRAPFNTNLVSQAAGVAALTDEEHVERSRTLVLTERPVLQRGLESLGAKVWPSQGNFLLADFPGRSGKQLFEALLREGVVVRPVAGYGFPESQRITVGLPEQNRKCLDALKKVLAK